MISQDFNQPLATATVLQKIVLDKVQWIKQQESQFPLIEFKQNLTQSDRSFYKALAQGSQKQPAYILECKKASPSKGLIRTDFNLVAIAQVYKNYASAISVLTDEKYFQGSFSYLTLVREVVSQPVLCKDFIISEYQVYLARFHQADAILLMLSVLNDDSYRQLSELAHSLGMGVLTETSNEAEFERALNLQAKIIGVNNRNLHDLSVDLSRVEQLTQKYADRIPSEVRIISESGINDHHQIRHLQQVANGFLIGSSLMGSRDLNFAVRSVMFGENKICGLTRPQDVQTAYQAGALYGGLIFAEQSKRRVELSQAQQLVSLAPLAFVGVFQNQPINFVTNIAYQLNLFAVQLHGEENAEFINQLREKLPPTCQIWKAVSVNVEQQHSLDLKDNPLIDRYVFDSQSAQQRGGTGKTFNWRLIPENLKHKIMLAGGISPENIELALSQNCIGLDLNSGVETEVGIKDKDKIKKIFSKILAN